MNFEAAKQGRQDNYKLLIGSVVPRPIAWVSTQSADGKLNLAPYSFFQAVSGDPPTVMVSVGRRADGSWKDTALNALATGELVVNLVNLEVVEPMNASSATYPHGVSEFELVGVSPAPSKLVKPPRVAEAPIAFECQLRQTVPLGPGEGSNLLLLAEVVGFYVRDDLYDRGRVNPERLRPVGRLAGNQYSKPGEIFELIRPD